jgi:hypothetical protein
MGFQDVADAYVTGFVDLQIDFDIPARVDDGANPGAFIAQQIG